MSQASMQIRSYGAIFGLERRIHRLERWRVPVPYGIPLRGIAYTGAALVAVLVLSGLPVVGQLLGALPPALRYGGLPLTVGVGLMRWTVDGRPAHLVIRAWLRYASAPKRVVAFRAARRRARVEIDDVAIAPDDRAARPRRAIVEGPATVIARYPIEARSRGRALYLRQRPGPALWRGKQIVLKPGQRLVIR